MSHKKFGPDRFSRFDVYWIQTNRQTDRQTNRQAKFIYIYVLCLFMDHLNLKISLQPNKTRLSENFEFFL